MNLSRALKTTGAVTAVVMMSVGCTSRAPAPTPSASSAPATATTTTAATASQTTATTTQTAAPTPRNGTSNGQTYAVATDSIKGATADGQGQWNAEVTQLSGGDARVRDAFNKASHASGEDQVAQMRAEAAPDMPWQFEAKPTVTFRAVAIAEVIKGVYSAQHAAHPVNYVSTVVIDSRTARPITLADLFINQQDGLNRLSEQTKLIFPQVFGGPSPMPDEKGNQPIAANFANWIPTPSGMELHFTDYQFGHGLPVITVPWAALSNVLAPDMVALTHD